MTISADPLQTLLAISDGWDTARWNFPAMLGSMVGAQTGVGQGVSLTFSFMETEPEDVSYGSITGFAPCTSLQRSAARDALTSIASMVDLQFTEVQTTGQLTFAQQNIEGNSVGVGSYPVFSYSESEQQINSIWEAPAAGHIWIKNDVDYWSERGFNPSSSGFQTLLHEISHSLGLKHPFEQLTSEGSLLDSNYDTNKYTIMSYALHPNSLFRDVTITEDGYQTSYSASYHYLQPETLMPFDIVALQYLYGRNDTWETGANIYRFETDRPFIKTIWDAGGNDTISVSNFTNNCIINLNPGAYSSIAIPSDPLPSWASSDPNVYYDGTENLAIAYNSYIENAEGGSGADKLIGNTLNNALIGNDGNDELHGDAGNDALSGGNGTDTLSGDAGSDILRGGDGNDTLYGNDDADQLTGGSKADQLTGGMGADQFRYTKPSEGGDTITDFNGTQGDVLVFVSTNFGRLNAGTLSSTRFRASSTGRATTRSQRFLFNTTTGQLRYDADGTGSVAAVSLATLSGVSTLSAGQIMMAAS